jgi:predicted acetyltransferase
MKVELKPLAMPVDDGVWQMVLEIGPGENGFSNGLYAEEREEWERRVHAAIAMTSGDNLPEHYVPQTTYVLYAEGEPVGFGKLRPQLNEALHKHGGHIGYSIRPASRRQGFGKLLLGELMQEARLRGLDQVLLTCDETNAASRGVIESQGGVLEQQSEGTCKYWIPL